MIVCNRCGKENQENYRFCLGCGSDLVPRAVAPPPALEPVASGLGHDGNAGANGDDERFRPDPLSATVANGTASLAAAASVAAIQPQPASVAVSSSTPSSTAAPSSVRPHIAAATAPAALSPEPEIAVAAPPEDENTSSLSGAHLRTCPTCGNQVPVEFVFCGQCGTRLGAELSRAAPRPIVVAAPVARGKLVLIRPDGSEGGAFTLSESETTLGRADGALFETDTYLSPRHAIFAFRAAMLHVRDAGSLNGVFVKMSGEEEIADGEVFRMGQELLRFDVIRAAQPLEDGTEVMGSPNPGYWGRISVIIGRGQDGATYPVAGEAMVIGRERGDMLFPEDGYVSGAHARLTRREGRYYLADLNSSNGSFLRIRGERPLKSGSFLLLGQQLFRIQYS